MTGRIIWRAPLDWTYEQQLAIVAWLQAHHVETRTVAKRAVVTADEAGPQLHLAVYQTDAQGHRYADWTTELAVTLPLVVPCRFRPPVLVGAPVLDEQLLALPSVPILDAETDWPPQRVVVGAGTLDPGFVRMLDERPTDEPEQFVPRSCPER